MNLSKSEGFKGNTETTSYSTERFRGQQQQPKREPRTGGKTVKSRHISEILPSQSPSQKNKYLFLLINMIVFYGLQNRRTINHSVWQPLLRETYPCPPTPHLSAALNHKNIFRNFGGSNVY